MEDQLLNKISIAAPAYNEEHCIVDTITTWHKYLQDDISIGLFEIVICNDGSKDNTGTLLNKLSSEYKKLRVVEHDTNQGAAAALTTAIKHTQYDWILLLDSDGQFPIENLNFFRSAMDSNNALSYIGVRLKKQDSMFARFGSWSSGFICNIFYNTSYKDFNSACKLVKGEVLRSINIEAKGLNYSTDITAKLIEAGYPPIEVEIIHDKRSKGKSSRTLIGDAFKRFLFVMYIVFRRILILLNVLQKPLLK